MTVSDNEISSSNFRIAKDKYTGACFVELLYDEN